MHIVRVVMCFVLVYFAAWADYMFMNHYSDVIMARWRLKSPALHLFTQPFIQTQIEENIKAPRHWPFCGEFTDDR